MGVQSRPQRRVVRVGVLEKEGFAMNSAHEDQGFGSPEPLTMTEAAILDEQRTAEYPPASPDPPDALTATGHRFAGLEDDLAAVMVKLDSLVERVAQLEVASPTTENLGGLVTRVSEVERKIATIAQNGSRATGADFLKGYAPVVVAAEEATGDPTSSVS